MAKNLSKSQQEERREPAVTPVPGLDQHYRAKTLAVRLGISLSYAKLILARREIESVRIGSAVLVSESAVREYLERHKVPARA